MRVLGLMSGTSVDGVDAAVADIQLAGEVLRLRRVGEQTLPWPAGLRERILAGTSATVAEVCRLDHEIGAALGEVAAAAVTRFGPVELVASHGQTLHHEVDQAGRVRGTLQLGQPAQIAERTGLPVVADLRVRDVAAGGQGAPLVSILDQLLLTHPRLATPRLADHELGVMIGADRRPEPHGRHQEGAEPVAALNLGGIANLTVVRPGEPTLAFDCGPANALLDAAVTGWSGERFDHGGARTAQGTVDQALLAVLRADPYLAASPPKSTGKERYHAGYLAAALAQAPVARLDDLLATLAELTAVAVAADAARYRVRRVWAAGGGVHNAGLMAALRRRLAEHQASLATTDELGLPVDAKEAYAFAVLGWLTWHGLPGTLPSCTGADGPRILGAITPGAVPLRLPPPASTPPASLIMDQDSA